MNYTRKSFTISPPTGERYGENWRQTFGEPDKSNTRCRSALFSGAAKGNCTLEAGHAGRHVFTFLPEAQTSSK